MDADSEHSDNEGILEHPACVDPDPVDSHIRPDAGTNTEDPEDNLAQIVWDTWSGRHFSINKHQSDSEMEEVNEGSDSDLEFEWKEMGNGNGLEMDEFVNEDFERIIAQFGAFRLSLFIQWSNSSTI